MTKHSRRSDPSSSNLTPPWCQARSRQTRPRCDIFDSGRSRISPLNLSMPKSTRREFLLATAGAAAFGSLPPSRELLSPAEEPTDSREANSLLPLHQAFVALPFRLLITLTPTPIPVLT